MILGYLSLNRDVPDPRLRGQLAAVEDEALRCKGIVDGMLELSRPRRSTAGAVDLRALCDDVCGSLRLSAVRRRAGSSSGTAGVAVADGASSVSSSSIW